ncbi:unnamed protein product [Trichogramma brassicae]|uniref:Uncharacterized protein n=1 Tax=Trichogramma brassicae TaxID=86971 RepID=A0A6H5ITH0_9HYME|nr:unnamed protein product [Trichogramma brassicae]
MCLRRHRRVRRADQRLFAARHRLRQYIGQLRVRQGARLQSAERAQSVRQQRDGLRQIWFRLRGPPRGRRSEKAANKKVDRFSKNTFRTNSQISTSAKFTSSPAPRRRSAATPWPATTASRSAAPRASPWPRTRPVATSTSARKIRTRARNTSDARTPTARSLARRLDRPPRRRPPSPRKSTVARVSRPIQRGSETTAKRLRARSSASTWTSASRVPAAASTRSAATCWAATSARPSAGPAGSSSPRASPARTWTSAFWATTTVGYVYDDNIKATSEHDYTRPTIALAALAVLRQQPGRVQVRAAGQLRRGLPPPPERQLRRRRRVPRGPAHVLARLPPLLREPRRRLRVHHAAALLPAGLRVLAAEPPVPGRGRVPTGPGELRHARRALPQSAGRLQVRAPAQRPEQARPPQAARLPQRPGLRARAQEVRREAHRYSSKCHRRRHDQRALDSSLRLLICLRELAWPVL